MVLNKEKDSISLAKHPYMKASTEIPMYGGDAWKVFHNTGDQPDFSKDKVILAFVKPTTKPIPFDPDNKDNLADPEKLFRKSIKLVLLVVDANAEWHISAFPAEALDYFDSIEDTQTKPEYDTVELPEWGKAIDQSDASAVAAPKIGNYSNLTPEKAIEIMAEFIGCGAVDLKNALRKVQKIYAKSPDKTDAIRATLLHPAEPVDTQNFYS